MDTCAPAPVRIRHVYVLDGRALGDYVEKPANQVEAICRKRRPDMTFGLWKFLKKQGRVRLQSQRLNNQTWNQLQ